ncbi:MAG: hypothetical protein ONB30_12850 [candidate division KSB1 bacterium]|nr:hypothetical protein [candidate division KSB1 bacterium]MDZ7386808.1 hypothetical protein [candidate division KSB1 bacterium]MDZ7392222.1 hypothetical protein [candidate division KSB1 bacterium]MDZ7413786.1 hypothetical protein [candidate division KSB1 bacterium]
MMKKGSLMVLILLCSAMVACGGGVHKYAPPSTPPKAVFVGSQIRSLHTDGRLHAGTAPMMQAVTEDGRRYEGRLVQINDRQVVLAEGYRTRMEGNRVVREERIIDLQKHAVVMLKIW